MNIERSLTRQHRQLIRELRSKPFLPYADPDAARRREERRRINRRLIELEEALSLLPSQKEPFGYYEQIAEDEGPLYPNVDRQPCPAPLPEEEKQTDDG